jgi:ribosomal protein S12 methylthiotransferase
LTDVKKHCGSNVRPRRVAFQTLGCAKNTVDSDSLAGVLRASGFECVSQPHRADVLIVNTCGFLDDAKVESVEVMLEAVRWKAAREGRQVFAMGCLTQRDDDDVRESIPELDGVFGIGQWARMLEALGRNPVAVDTDGAAVTSYSGYAGPGSAYLRISDGCSHACAFCSIPQMRGLYRSEPLEALLREAESLAQAGKEIILIGQETTSYGVDLYRERRLVELCQRLNDLPGSEWIRLLYAHPPSTPPNLLEQLAAIPKFLPYIDFPIEHASDRMLKRMNRRTSVARMREAIAAFRAARPDACVRTTVLVGFPGETDEDFADLYQFMEETRFERAGVFVYSPQDGTAGAAMSEKVEEGIALDRLDQLMRLQRRICLEKHQALIGRTVDVLVERNGRGVSWGRSVWDAPDIDGRVRISEIVPPGHIVPVRIVRAQAYQVEGELLSPGRENAQRDKWSDHSLPAQSLS